MKNEKYYPQNKDCTICKGYGCPQDDMDELGYLDCIGYLKRKKTSKEKVERKKDE